MESLGCTPSLYKGGDWGWELAGSDWLKVSHLRSWAAFLGSSPSCPSPCPRRMSVVMQLIWKERSFCVSHTQFWLELPNLANKRTECLAEFEFLIKTARNLLVYIRPKQGEGHTYTRNYATYIQTWNLTEHRAFFQAGILTLTLSAPRFHLL